jgi:glycosyltransferase involved in cell wall biosynthesis
MKKIGHVITGLEPGGAENLLLRLAGRLEGADFRQSVLSFRSGGRLESAFTGMGIPVEGLGLRKNGGDAFRLFRLWGWLREGKFDLVQTWLPDPNVVGGLAAWTLGIPVVWGLHQANLSPELNGARTLRMLRWGARWSRRVPRRIVCVGEAVRLAHVAAGFSPDPMRVIPLGFDTDLFRPRPDVRAAVRLSWGVTPENPVIGLVARYDPHKDIPTFLDAARILKSKRPDARFVLCGSGMERGNAVLSEALEARNLRDVILLGQRDQVQDVFPGFDVATLSSVSEGFPSVLGEAMACGVPCAATAVGDIAELLGDTGRTVPAKHPSALAEAWGDLLALSPEERRNRGLAGRARIEKNFSVGSVAARYRALYDEVLGAPR